MDKDIERRLQWALERIRHVRELAITLHANDAVIEAGRLRLLTGAVEEAEVSLAKVIRSENG